MNLCWQWGPWPLCKGGALCSFERFQGYFSQMMVPPALVLLGPETGLGNLGTASVLGVWTINMPQLCYVLQSTWIHRTTLGSALRCNDALSPCVWRYVMSIPKQRCFMFPIFYLPRSGKERHIADWYLITPHHGALSINIRANFGALTLHWEMGSPMKVLGPQRKLTPSGSCVRTSCWNPVENVA